MDRFRQLKKQNPQLHIHAFNLAARVAAYNDNHEDPEYWQEYGYDIWRYTWLWDKKKRAGISEKEAEAAGKPAKENSERNHARLSGTPENGSVC